MDPALYVSRRAEIEPDSGCVEFGIYEDVNRDGYFDLISTAVSGPECTVWLGSENGYSASRALLYPIATGGGGIFADLNLDRNPELLLAGNDPPVLKVHWGTPAGPSRDSSFTLTTTAGHEALFVAELDNDGYLDIVVGCDDGRVMVFWGSGSGFHPSDCTVIPLGGHIYANLEAADFNRDGFRDVAVCRTDECQILSWHAGRTWTIASLPFPTAHPHGLSVADLDGNGWLDVVLSEFYTSLDKSYIYWGDSAGYSPVRRTELDIIDAYGGSAIADLNRDGRLDVLYFRGYGSHVRPKAFYNTGDYPWFDGAHSADIGPFALYASGGIAADLNFDSVPDVFVCQQEQDVSNYVLWGPDYTDYTALPVQWDHHGTFREPGNVYSRTSTGYFLSGVFDAGALRRPICGTCYWVGRESEACRIRMEVRSGDSPAADSNWTSFTLIPGSGASIPDSAITGRYLQFRATFLHGRPVPLPTLEAVEFELVEGVRPALDVGVTSILSPAGEIDSGTVTVPSFVVRNFGTDEGVFPVTMRIGEGYEVVLVETLAAGISDTLGVAAWVADAVGELAVDCYSALSGDENASNDSAEGTVMVARQVVSRFKLTNSPNPLRSGVSLVIALPVGGLVDLSIYARDGRRVRSLLNAEELAGGIHLLEWDGTDDQRFRVAPGVYVCLVKYRHAGTVESLGRRLVLVN